MRILLSALLLIGSLGAAPFSFGTPAKTEAPKPATLPMPGNLKPGWWGYYDVPVDKLKKHVKATADMLSEIEKTLSDEQRLRAKPFINQILTGLSTLETLATFTPPPAQPIRDRLDEYNFDQFLDLGTRFADEKENVTVTEEKMSLLSATISNNRKKLDTLTSEYIRLKQRTTAKVVKGLEIMARRIANAIEAKQMSFLKALYSQQKTRLTGYAAQIKYARNHLAFTPERRAEIDGRIAKARLELQEALQSFLQVQAEDLKNGDDFVTQEHLHDRIVKANAELAFINVQMEKVFYLLATKQFKGSIALLYQRKGEWETEIENINKEIHVWTRTTQINLEHSLSTLSEGDTESTEVEDARKTLEYAQNTLFHLQNLNVKLSQGHFVLAQVNYLVLEQYSTWTDRLKDYWYRTKDFFRRHAKWFSESIFSIGETPVTPMGLIRLIITIIIAYLVAHYTRLGIRKYGKTQTRGGKAATYSLSRVAFYVIFLAGLLIAFSSLGFDFTTLAVVAGALSVGIGFGLQSIFNNFIAGLIVLFEQKIRVGDYIELESGEQGTVLAIHVRTTLIRTLDNLEILIPNSDFVAKKFINWTLSENERRIRVHFGIDKSVDIEKVRSIAVAAAKKVPISLDQRHPKVWIKEVTDTQTVYELVVWVDEYVTGRRTASSYQKFAWEIENAFRHESIPLISMTRPDPKQN